MAGAFAVPQVSPEAFAFLIDGTINNQEKVIFVLDTGSSTVIVSNQTAQKLHFKPFKSHITGATVKGTFDFDRTRIDMIAFGPLVLKNLDAEYPHKSIDYTSQIGRNVLSEYH